MSNHKLTPEEQFLKYHEKLRSELNKAYSHYEICKYIRGLGKDYLAELNEARTFFSLTADAHLFATVMSINRFIDKSKKSLKMDVFFKFVEGNLDIFSDVDFENRLRREGRYDEHWVREHVPVTSDMVRQDRKRLHDLPIDNIREWRHKMLAHIEEEYVLKNVNVMQESPVKVEEIDRIIGTLDQILNRYLVAYDGSGWDIGLPPTEHQIRYIVDAIRFRRESRDTTKGTKS